ncbi:MAG: acyltransferase [Candidatus Omnitrophica bacterium]|nr:acyltransferase [Candidatus Omnitrophota bacterium]
MKKQLGHNDRLDFLDMLRALAIFLVVIGHYKASFLPGGSIGVAIFFCLSGYLITNILLKEDAGFFNFIVRRFFRVYPPYFCICMFYLMLLYFFFPSDDFNNYLKALPGLIFFIKMPDKIIGIGVSVFWTLHIEFWFYMLIPFLVLPLKKNKKMLYSCIIFLILVSFVIKFTNLLGGMPFPESIMNTFRWMDNLLYGVVVALAAKDISVKPSQGAGSKVVFGLILTMLILSALFVPSKGNVWFLQASLASFLTAVLLFIYFKRRFDAGFYYPKVVLWVGLISYSLYLTHGIPMDWREHLNLQRGLLKSVFVFLSLVFLPVLLHYFVEKPSIRIGKILSQKVG